MTRHGHVLIVIKLLLSLNVFKYTPVGVSSPKNKIFHKQEVSHEKVKIFTLDTALKLN